jgi:hypothetical protein
MSPFRAISLVAILATVFSGSLTCAPASAEIPVCRGEFESSIINGPDGALPTPESAASRALEVTYQTDVRMVVLSPQTGYRYVVTSIDGVALDDPPIVRLERTAKGFIPAGVIC